MPSPLSLPEWWGERPAHLGILEHLKCPHHSGGREVDELGHAYAASELEAVAAIPAVSRSISADTVRSIGI